MTLGTAGEPEVIRTSGLCMQVCVPEWWTDEQIKEFAEAENPCGTANGWQIRRQGDRFLEGANERVACDDNRGMVHVMLDA
jgi:hypothetical protein